MNPAFDAVLAASSQDRAGAFRTTAQRLGSTEQNIEKDFWVCWTLDALFNGRPAGAPRLLFKGGTSLSKGYGLIKRFSEDVDVAVSRDDLGVPTTPEKLEGMARASQTKKLKGIVSKCSEYIQGPLKTELTQQIADVVQRTRSSVERFYVEADPDDPEALLLWYPKVTADDPYIRAAVKIESGAKSSFDPNTTKTVQPYVDDDFPDLDLSVPNIVTVDPMRTFWDKVILVHGLRAHFLSQGVLPGGAERVSRHYYDLHCLMNSKVGPAALKNTTLGESCLANARTFYDRTGLDLESAKRPWFALKPNAELEADLRTDYARMGPMIFGKPPPFGTILKTVADLQNRLNG
jgi:hypothetical protein